MYEAETTLFVASLSSNDYGAAGAQQAAKSFASLPQSDPVLVASLQAVGDKNLSPSQLSSMITVENNLNSQFVIIRVRDRDPKQAAQLASEITKQSTILFVKAASNRGSESQFVKQEIDALEIQIKNLQKEIADAQAQTGSSTPAVSQQALINQLNTDLSGKLAMYSQLLNTYQSMSGFQVTLLQDAQIPKNPVGAGPIVTIAIGRLD